MTVERRAVVTGGAKNIGLGIARRLCDDGWRVFVLDIAEPEDDRLVADAVCVDLSDVDALSKALQKIVEHGPVTCLVNNVGIVRPMPFDQVDIADFDSVMHLNLRSGIVQSSAGPGRTGAGRIQGPRPRIAPRCCWRVPGRPGYRRFLGHGPELRPEDRT